MAIDTSRLEALAELVAEARRQDKETFDKMEEAKLVWKKANSVWNERQKVLDDYISSLVTEITHKDVD